MTNFAAFEDVPRGRYSAILADPPWSFKSWSDKGQNRAPDAMVRQKGLAERHYATMPMHEIRRLPLEVGAAWGFRFKTIAFTWAKLTKADRWHIGLGYWTRGNPESCLLFTRGKPRRQSAAVRQLIVSPRREHSRKPDEARERVEALVPGPYLEMFCREPRPGWDAFGNQLDRFSQGAAA